MNNGYGYKYPWKRAGCEGGGREDQILNGIQEGRTDKWKGKHERGEGV